MFVELCKGGWSARIQRIATGPKTETLYGAISICADIGELPVFLEICHFFDKAEVAICFT